MTQKEKEEMIKDFTARIPYRVKFHYSKHPESNVDYDVDDVATGYYNNLLVGYKADYCFDRCKSYLRPMSSMTEEESAELSNIISEWFDKELFYLTEEPFLEYALSRINYSINPLLFDWLNKNHFDYRGLIGKGLALETQ